MKAAGNAARARPPLACRQSVRYILNRMVQYTQARFDRQLWDARFDELDKVVEELKQKEKVDGRKKRG